MQACCCQVTRSFVSLYFITSNEDAEAGNSQWRAFRVDVRDEFTLEVPVGITV